MFKKSQESDRKRVLIVTRHYLPGYRAGANINLLANFVKHFGRHLQLYVVTLNCDALSQTSYTTVPTSEWIEDEQGTKIFYLPEFHINGKKWQELYRELKPDFIYLNSLFDYKFSIQWQLLKFRNKIKATLVINLGGDLAAIESGVRGFKKRCYLAFYNLLLQVKSTVYHAYNSSEKNLIFQKIKAERNIRIAPIMPNLLDERPASPKYKYPFRICCVAPIQPVSNTLFALQVLTKIQDIPISLSIIGAVLDEKYWRLCHQFIDKLHCNVEWENIEVQRADQLAGEIARHHLFFNPSYGLNWGHHIVQSLTVGTPVLISDRTPWRELTKFGIGWDLSLTKMDNFIAVIRNMSKADNFATENMRQNCFHYIQKHYHSTKVLKQYDRLFT